MMKILKRLVNYVIKSNNYMVVHNKLENLWLLVF
jgi:hypothetical protein